MTQDLYIEKHDGAYYVRNSRVSLDSIVYAFIEGLSPETIATECFPVLSLEQVYGAITYYLHHREEIDAYLKKEDSEYEEFRAEIRARNPILSRRLDDLLSREIEAVR